MDGTCLVFCEGAFNTPTGKTANGLVRFTERYEVLGVIDSQYASADAGDILDGRPCGIPVFKSIDDAIKGTGEKPDYVVIGLAPDGGRLPEAYRRAILSALLKGMNVDSGLHSFLNDDPEFSKAAVEWGGKIRDVRQSPPRDELHFWSGAINDVDSLKIAVLGTDSAIGKRTTLNIIHRELRNRGTKSSRIGTGQTAWFQGFQYVTVMDATINDFVAGELEHAVITAWKEQEPEVILIEGQGCLTHPAYPGGFEIIGACRPDAYILQHSPARRDYDGFPGIPVAGLQKELDILKILTEAIPLAITINHEYLTNTDVEQITKEYEEKYQMPCCDPLIHGCGKIAGKINRMLEMNPKQDHFS